VLSGMGLSSLVNGVASPGAASAVHISEAAR
jgi:hypothetical protein